MEFLDRFRRDFSPPGAVLVNAEEEHVVALAGQEEQLSRWAEQHPVAFGGWDLAGL